TVPPCVSDDGLTSIARPLAPSCSVGQVTHRCNRARPDEIVIATALSGPTFRRRPAEDRTIAKLTTPLPFCTARGHVLHRSHRPLSEHHVTGLSEAPSLHVGADGTGAPPMREAAGSDL